MESSRRAWFVMKGLAYASLAAIIYNLLFCLQGI